MDNWKNIFRSWRGVPVLILAILAVVWLVSQWTPLFNSEARRVRKLAEEMERVYREDKYGGKTPEETYDLFISALKAGNIELSSKYFGPDDQNEWGQALRDLKDENKLQDFTRETEEHRKSWVLENNDGEKATFIYSYRREKPRITELPIVGGKIQKLTLPAGTFNAEVKFYRNTYTNVWKIETP